GFDFEDLSKKITHQALTGIFTGLYEEGGGLVLGENTLLRIGFEKLVYANGSKCTPPLFAGNDALGVISVDYALRLMHFGALESPLVFYVEDRWGEAVYRALKDEFSSVLVSPLDLDAKVASQIRRVKPSSEGVVVTLDNGSKIRAKYVVYSTVRQPNLELPAQTGFTYSFNTQWGKIVCTNMEATVNSNQKVFLAGSVTGVYELNEAFRHGIAVGYMLSGDTSPALGLAPPARVAAHVPIEGVVHPDAFICFCEDVTVRDFLLAKRKKINGSEKVKRFTGWGTGVCQGKLCVANGMRLLGGQPYTQRLPTQPTPLGWLASLGE
ncbi:MAG: (2Fe-2S)-binding protein, partial [Thermoprotei archaeon]